jgi:hypothetical protein
MSVMIGSIFMILSIIYRKDELSANIIYNDVFNESCSYELLAGASLSRDTELVFMDETDCRSYGDKNSGDAHSKLNYGAIASR